MEPRFLAETDDCAVADTASSGAALSAYDTYIPPGGFTTGLLGTAGATGRPLYPPSLAEVEPTAVQAGVSTPWKGQNILMVTGDADTLGPALSWACGESPIEPPAVAERAAGIGLRVTRGDNGPVCVLLPELSDTAQLTDEQKELHTHALRLLDPSPALADNLRQRLAERAGDTRCSHLEPALCAVLLRLVSV